MGKIETANGSRGNHTFPAGWGEPPGDPYSEERAAWVMRNIHDAPVRRKRTLSGAAAMAKVEALMGKRDIKRNAHLALLKAESLARSSHNALARAVHAETKYR